MSVERRSTIITFKPKETRKDKTKDKLEIVTSVLEAPVQFFESAAIARGEMPRDLPAEMLGYDINQYETPIVVAHLTDKEADALRKNANVARVEEDGLCYASHLATADFTLEAPPVQPITRPGDDLSQLLFEGVPVVQAETVPAGLSQIAAPSAWNITRGLGVKVAVLDTGIDYTHPDLRANVRGGVSFVPGESSPMDYNRHGTHCAGTIAAGLNGIGVVGVAPSAYLYAVKVLSASGSGAWSNLIAGLDWCIRNGIHIASMSLGAASAPAAVGDMCRLAFDRGVLLIAAAGNAAGAVGAPALYPSVIAVSAITSSNTLASFSNRGPKIELCAPGVSVLSTLPGNTYGNLSGTSMACPHVSGVAALAWSSHRFPPNGLRQNVSIRRLLAATADNLGAPGRDPDFGFGRVNATRAAFDFTVPSALPGLP